MERRIEEAFAGLRDRGRLVVLTGAGISAESGVPTFRGPEGYWTVGSVNYRPEEMATSAMFERHPEEVWQWYLYRIGICRAAAPNPGHEAVARMEQLLGDRFVLLTQNVDGIHLRAGNSEGRTYQIHGNIETVRCGASCSRATFPLPGEVEVKRRDEPLAEADSRALQCQRCGAWVRPHVLWFDECYDEEHFRFESSLAAASRADVLLVVGTSGATNLPMQVGMTAASRGALIVDVNPDPNPFSRMAERGGGFFIEGPAGEALPELAAAIEG
jgi:NAD-dependent deacetylase